MKNWEKLCQGNATCKYGCQESCSRLKRKAFENVKNSLFLSISESDPEESWVHPLFCSPACEIQKSRSTDWKWCSFCSPRSEQALGGVYRQFKCTRMLHSFHFPDENLKQVASRCIPNGMLIDLVQKEIRDVNVFEKLLSKSLHPLQTVVWLNTEKNVKNLPAKAFA